MQSTDPIDAREMEITKIAESKEDIAVLRKHLKDVIEGPSFKGSHRSGQFLAHVVEQAMAGHCDELKERLIGVELFGRSPSYDTGEDAIVRVTASDVRRRLLQHYGTYGTGSEFRIRLPLGTYIPEISRDVPVKAGVPEPASAPTVDSPDSPDALVPSPLVTNGQEAVAEEHEREPGLSQAKRRWIQRIVLLCCLGIS